MSYWSKCDNNIKAIFSASSCELTVYILLVEILESSHLTASNSSRFVRDQRTKLSFQSWVANANAYSNSCYRNEQSHLKVNCDDFQRYIKSAVRWKYRFMYIYGDIFFISPKDWKIPDNKTELNVYRPVELPRFVPKSQSKHIQHNVSDWVCTIPNTFHTHE